jgi:site-specific DNA-cytosine methylase
VKVRVLSLFDGMSCGRIALERAGIDVEAYYASEVDKYAIKVSEANYQDIERLGDVQRINYQMLPKIDLLIAGSPCQGFSFAGKQLNFSDPRSALFFEFVHAKNEIDPKYFLLENVVMKKEYQDAISELLGCEPIKINSSVVSAQNRNRLYWTNIQGIEQPVDIELDSRSIIEGDGFPASTHRFHSHDPGHRTVKVKPKFPCLSASYGRGWPNTDSRPGVLVCDSYDGARTANITPKEFRNLTLTECERLQTVPDGYTQNKGVSNSQCYKMLGNGWTVDVIAHIFSHMDS